MIEKDTFLLLKYQNKITIFSEILMLSYPPTRVMGRGFSWVQSFQSLPVPQATPTCNSCRLQNPTNQQNEMMQYICSSFNSHFENFFLIFFSLEN
jgi:hypothetical protein